MTESTPDAAIADPFPAQVAAFLDPLGTRTAVAARRLAHLPSLGVPLTAGMGESSRPRADPQRRDEAAGSVLLRAEVPLPMGTLARLGVAVELLRRVDLGQFRLEETLDAVTARSSEQGAETDENATLTLSAACARMLAAEEPVAIEATAVLIELVGLGETNETLSRLKLEATHLTREEDGGRARASHRESTTTAGDMLTLLGLLSGSAIPGAAQLRETLARQARESAVRAVLPLEAELAHLPDIAGRHAHDVGWMRGPGGGCAFCVLIADMDDTDRAKRALEGVLRLFWSVWCAG